MFKINHLVIEKQVVITDDKSINCYVNNEILEPERVGLILHSKSMNIQKLSEVFNSFINKQVCQCGHMAIHFPGNECILLHISIVLFC